MSITILLADDHKIIREGLRSLLERESDLQVITEADNGAQAVRLALEHRPEVVIMDISMPHMDGIEATRQIIARLPEVKVVVLSMHADRRFVIEALRAGATGFLLKDCAFQELARAVRAVMADQTFLCSTVSKMMPEEYRRRGLPPDGSASAVLTERESEPPRKPSG